LATKKNRVWPLGVAPNFHRAKPSVYHITASNEPSAKTLRSLLKLFRRSPALMVPAAGAQDRGPACPLRKTVSFIMMARLPSARFRTSHERRA
jgi:hypothetical protein